MEERRAIHHWHEVANPTEWTFEDEHGHEVFRRGEGEAPQEMEEAGYLEVAMDTFADEILDCRGACEVWGTTGVCRQIRVRWGRCADDVEAVHQHRDLGRGHTMAPPLEMKGGLCTIVHSLAALPRAPHGPWGIRWPFSWRC